MNSPLLSSFMNTHINFFPNGRVSVDVKRLGWTVFAQVNFGRQVEYG